MPEKQQGLTSVQIAKVISGLLGSMAQWNDVDEIIGAIDWLAANRDVLRFSFSSVKTFEATSPAVQDLKDQFLSNNQVGGFTGFPAKS